MRKSIAIIAIVALAALFALAGCAAKEASSPERTSGASSGAMETSEPAVSASAAEAPDGEEDANPAETSAVLLISINDVQLAVNPADTEAARALMEHLQAGPVTVSLHAYGGFEQVGSLPWSLPTSDEQITTSPGDVMLYQGDQITIFTGSNSWAYTPLGSIEGATSEMLLEAFGGETAEITLSLAQ